MTGTRAFGASARLAAGQLRTEPDAWLVLVTSPVTVLTLLAITRGHARADLVGIAVVAPSLMALFRAALFDAAEQLSADRWRGVLEIAVAAPVSQVVVVLGRATTVAGFALISVVQSVLLVRIITGHAVIQHPAVALLVAAATVLATVCLVLPLSVVFVLTRAVRVFQNALPWPVFLVSGVVVPVAMLPEWTHPISRVIYLTWSAQLLRDATRPDPVPNLLPGLLALVASSTVALVAGMLLMRWALARLRRNGELAVA